MMRTSDIVFQFLAKKGITHVFVISGGGNIHLVDALGRSTIKYVCNHHEQASATAAEGYARITGLPGVALVTTGPGGTNAITGVAGAWLDSIPMLVLSGQVRRDMLGTPSGMRQLGVQEINIIDMVKPITKYAVTILDPNDIFYHLEKAWYLATRGRPGPVWLDIPVDVQGARVDEKHLRHFDPTEVKPTYETDPKKLTKLVQTLLTKLKASKRPVLYGGHGIRLSGAHGEFLKLIDLLKIPVLVSYVGYDMVPETHRYFFGRAHAIGQRSANFILQNSDFLFSIGARLDPLTIGYTYKAFARAAYKVVVDVDKKELTKPILSVDLPIHYDAKQVIGELNRQLTKKPLNLSIQPWISYGHTLRKKYPVVPKDSCKKNKPVNPYCFIQTIGRILRANEIIVETNGTWPLNCMYQAFPVKKGQRIVLNLGCAQMGYGLPAAIGASVAAPGRRIICFEGDGSLQLNIHELEVVRLHKLPIKLFVYSNDGYVSIKNTQRVLFHNFFVASDSRSGLTCPDYVKVARAYGIRSIRIRSHSEMEEKIHYALSYPGPILVDIVSDPSLIVTPKLESKKLPDGSFASPPLEDMAPFLSEEEMKENMLIPLWK